MKFIAPREGANAPRTRSFLKLYWLLCYAAVLFAAPLTDSMANSRPTGSISDVTLTVAGGKHTINLLNHFSDPDGDTLYFRLASSNYPEYVTVSLSGSTLTLTPVAKGAATIRVGVNDGKLALAPSFTATVNNSAPWASNATFSKSYPAGSTSSTNMAPFFNDSDGDPLTFSASSSDTSKVTVSVSGSTVNFTYVAEGSATVSVTASDGSLSSPTISISVTVTPPENNAPTGSLSAVTLTVAGGAQTVDLSSNFSDADEDTLTYSASSSNTSNVTVNVSGSTLTVTPVAKGSSTITVTANDGTTSTNVTFTATVNNSAPTGSLSDVTLTVGGGAKTINLLNSFSDPDGDTLYFGVTSSHPEYVTASVSGSTLTLTPVAKGASTIRVGANDGRLALAPAFTATVEPEPPSDPPENGDDPPPPPVTNPTAPRNNVNNRSPQALGTVNPIVLSVGDTQQVSANFSDPDGDTLSYSVSGGNSAASAGISGNTVTVTGLDAGEATFTVTATDPHGATATQTIDVTVSQQRQAIRRTATVLSKVSGDNQSAPIRTALSDPLVVEVRDELGRLVEGAEVQFELADGGGTLDPISITDTTGQASTTLVFGDNSGEFTVEASIPGSDQSVLYTVKATLSSLDVVYIDALETEPNPDDSTMNRVYGVAFSPDGKTLASAHGDRSVRMWDVETRELKRTLGGSLEASSIERRGHKSETRSVAFSPDGNILASGGTGGRVLLWDANTGRLKKVVFRHAGAVLSLAFSPDGNTLAAATEGGYVYIYDISNLKSVERKHWLRAHSARVWSVAFSPDGRFLASSGGDASVRLWDHENGRHKKTLRGHEEQVLSVVFGAGDTLASGSADGTVRLWDVDTGSSRILAGHTDWVFGVAFHPNGEILASTGKDMSVRLWDTTSGMPLNTLARHTNWGHDVAISRDGILASAGYHKFIHLWDTGVKWDDVVEAVENREDAAQQQPTAELLPNYPNPFNPETWIPYHLEAASDVSLSIYNVSGRLVRTMELGYQSAGLYANRSEAIYWDGRNNHGEQVASGVYVYRLTAGDYSASRRMVIVK